MNVLHHPAPWQISFATLPEWHKQSMPYIEDANGEVVCYMAQHVDHPGEFDIKAFETANRIVEAVNAKGNTRHS